jgi:hypothetical protein
MWQIAQNSIVLFFRGKLFKDRSKALGWILVGVLFTAAALVVIELAVVRLQLPLGGGFGLVVAAALSGFLGGMLQPYLFRDLKYQ